MELDKNSSEHLPPCANLHHRTLYLGHGYRCILTQVFIHDIRRSEQIPITVFSLELCSRFQKALGGSSINTVTVIYSNWDSNSWAVCMICKFAHHSRKKG